MPKMTLRGYAGHRGVSLAAVQKAIKSGRIHVCRTEQRGDRVFSYVESEEADRLWSERSDPVQQRNATRREMGKGPQTPNRQAPEPNLDSSDAVPDSGSKSKVAAGGGQYAELYTKGRAIRENFTAKRAALEYAKAMKKVVDVDTIKVVFFRASNAVQHSLMNLPVRIHTRICAAYRVAIDSVISSIQGGQTVTISDIEAIMAGVLSERTCIDIMEKEIRHVLTQLSNAKFTD